MENTVSALVFLFSCMENNTPKQNIQIMMGLVQSKTICIAPYKIFTTQREITSQTSQFD